MENAGRIDAKRFIQKLDGCFDRGDMRAARECLEFWENEARTAGDDRGLLTVLNEAVGYYRRTQKRSKALRAMEECLSLVDRLGIGETLSGATIYINAATTLSFFGNEEEGLALYEKAANCYEKSGATDTYEYAALLNNRAGTLEGLKRYDEAEKAWLEAIEILKRTGGHDGEIAISLVMLAHLTFDRDENACDRVEELLDEAWDRLNSDDQPKDGNYAYVLRKCAPSFDYFQRPMEAQALWDVAAEINELYREK
jgi:tetratricopeptide (TPR) repeat protein